MKEINIGGVKTAASTAAVEALSSALAWGPEVAKYRTLTAVGGKVGEARHVPVLSCWFLSIDGIQFESWHRLLGRKLWLGVRSFNSFAELAEFVDLIRAELIC